MEIWQQILLEEEATRRQSAAANPIPKQQPNISRPAPQQAPQTFIFDRDNYNTSLSMIEVLNIDGKSGLIEDFFVKSPSSDYTIDLIIDDNIVNFMYTWSELYEMSQDIESVVATKRNGQYVAGLSNMYFTKNVTLNILATGIEFKKIFAKGRYNG